MHGAIVNAGAQIGNNCIVNSQALLEHGVEVHDHCHISTGALINGDVTIGKGSFIGSGATIKEKQECKKIMWSLVLDRLCYGMCLTVQW